MIASSKIEEMTLACCSPSDANRKTLEEALEERLESDANESCSLSEEAVPRHHNHVTTFMKRAQTRNVLDRGVLEKDFQELQDVAKSLSLIMEALGDASTMEGLEGQAMRNQIVELQLRDVEQAAETHRWREEAMALRRDNESLREMLVSEVGHNMAALEVARQESQALEIEQLKVDLERARLEASTLFKDLQLEQKAKRIAEKELAAIRKASLSTD